MVVVGVDALMAMASAYPFVVRPSVYTDTYRILTTLTNDWTIFPWHSAPAMLCSGGYTSHEYPFEMMGRRYV